MKDRFKKISLNRLVVNHNKELTIFMIAFSLRLLPEVISWPWLIGWDTPEYVASLKDFVASPTILSKSVWYGGKRFLPPLLNVLLYPLALLIDPWYIFKVLSPVIYGFEVLSFYHLMKSLDLDERTSLISTLIFTFYPVSLRFSWDLYRNSLGLIFLLGLMHELIREERSWKIFLLSLGAFLSNEFTFALSFLLISLSVLMDLKRARDLVVSKLAALLLGLPPIYLFSTSSRPFIIVSLSHITPLKIVGNKLLPVLILFLPLLMLLPLGFIEMRARKLKRGMYIELLLLMLIFFSFSDMILPIRFPAWNRWMYHMVIPFSAYAGIGLRGKKWCSVYLSVILLLGIAFTVLPYPIESSSEVQATTGNIKLSGFDVNISGLLRVLRSISRGTEMTYTMMHSTVPLQLEVHYVNASKHVSNMSFDRLIVDPEGYGFIHIERRFGLNVSNIRLRKRWEISYKLMRDLLEKNIKEFYVLGRKGMEITISKDIPSNEHRLLVREYKKFGPLILYRCKIIDR